MYAIHSRFSSWLRWLINNDDVKKVVRQAISVGYRAFDTARDYGNQNGVGKEIWNSDV